MGVVTAPLPEITFQIPLPTVGLLPFKMAEPAEIQMVWLVPALERVGLSSTVIVIFETEVHVPLIIAHSKTLLPVTREETTVVGDREFDIMPDPLIKDQDPVPTVGVLADIVVEEPQIVWLGAATEISGVHKIPFA